MTTILWHSNLHTCRYLFTLQFLLGSRLWWFQVCSEVAYFQVAPKNDSVRSARINTK